jgi:serine/threonine protein kinase/tetratricopeptide (TPR) repeat protein
MNAEPKSAKAIFLEAVERHAPEQWPAFLERACAGQPDLRSQVEALLEAHREVGTAEHRELPEGTDPGPVATVDVPPLRERPGTVIGPYKLLEPIGEGGMGTVWMAQQTAPVNRLVAVKLIKAGMDSKQVIARFEAERQALALMDHPNIARVLDAGANAEGRPYFAMELVKGIPITRYCDERRLSVRERLELFVPVCQAVQHAHQKGVIHRDLKPSNVLVAPYDGVPIVKVIDFGVAKAAGQPLTERTLATGLGAVVGTLEYMSPEQAELNNLDIDTRSDIYALGVLLYELLTGTTPLPKKRLSETAFAEVLRIIREDEPPKPSKRLSTTEELPSIAANRGAEPSRLTGLVRGELDWIVMKALEKDRDRRYQTASGLAMDVKRYLAGEPVQAVPPSVGYRLRKFVRRNKGPVLAAGLVVLTLVGGIVGTTLGLIEADHQRDAAQAAAEAEKKAKETAEAREKETRAILEFVERKVFAAARPEGQAGGLGWDVTLRKALEAALPFVDQSFPGQPLVEARLRLTLATSFGNLGDYKIAAAQAERARDLFAKNRGPDHPDTLASMHSLALCYEALGHQSEALKLREETLALMKAKLGPDDPKTLSAMNNLALSYAALNRHDEALKVHSETLALRKVKLGLDDPLTLNSMNNLALAYSALGRHDEALKLGQETLALRKVKLGPDRRATLGSMDSLACIYNAAGQPGEALKLYEEALALMKVKLGPDHPTTLTTMHDMASAYSALGRHGEAVELYEKTLALRKARLGPDHPDTLRTMNLLARLLATSSDPEVRNASREVELARKAVELAPKEGNYWNTLGAAFYRAGEWKASIHALETAMELRNGGDSFDWFFLAMAHWRLGEKDKAREWYDRAVQWMEKNQPKNEELRRFWAEASELLELNEKK